MSISATRLKRLRKILSFNNTISEKGYKLAKKLLRRKCPKVQDLFLDGLESQIQATKDQPKRRLPEDSDSILDSIEPTSINNV